MLDTGFIDIEAEVPESNVARLSSIQAPPTFTLDAEGKAEINQQSRQLVELTGFEPTNEIKSLIVDQVTLTRAYTSGWFFEQQIAQETVRLKVEQALQRLEGRSNTGILMERDVQGNMYAETPDQQNKRLRNYSEEVDAIRTGRVSGKTPIQLALELQGVATPSAFAIEAAVARLIQAYDLRSYAPLEVRDITFYTELINVARESLKSANFEFASKLSAINCNRSLEAVAADFLTTKLDSEEALPLYKSIQAYTHERERIIRRDSNSRNARLLSDTLTREELQQHFSAFIKLRAFDDVLRVNNNGEIYIIEPDGNSFPIDGPLAESTGDLARDKCLQDIRLKKALISIFGTN
jgi:hypothetical protein